RYGFVAAKHTGAVAITALLHSPFSIFCMLRGELDAIALDGALIRWCGALRDRRGAVYTGVRRTTGVGGDGSKARTMPHTVIWLVG
ncbi:MAG: hypothetical protein KAV82_08690, partial [Phycisphaerae bacterium]|nr:hypothetical protein [Phycisphaerae bacterium]